VSVNAVISIVGRRSYGVNIWCAPIADDSTSHVWCRKAECTSKGTGGSSDPNSPHGVPGCKRVRSVVKIRTRADGTRHEHDVCFWKAMVTKRAGVCIRELHPILIIQGLLHFRYGRRRSIHAYLCRNKSDKSNVRLCGNTTLHHRRKDQAI
jgi:hypothetical protein